MANFKAIAQGQSSATAPPCRTRPRLHPKFRPIKQPWT